jgi:hypothetical protein
MRTRRSSLMPYAFCASADAQRPSRPLPLSELNVAFEIKLSRFALSADSRFVPLNFSTLTKTFHVKHSRRKSELTPVLSVN